MISSYRQSILRLSCLAVAVCSCSLAQASLIAYWNLDGSTTAERLEESLGESALNASESGGSSAWVTRTGFGEVLSNGVNSPYLTVPKRSSIYPGAQNFSLSLWAYRTSDTIGTKGLVDFLSSSAGSGYQLFYQADNSIRIRLDDTSGNFALVDTQSTHYALNTWQNIIITVDRDTDKVRIYVNGVEATASGGVSIAALTGSIIPDQDFLIGSFNGNTAARGKLDDIALFDHALTATEIALINANGGTPISQVDFTPTSTVSFSPASGILRSGDLITITPAAAVDAIYYTTDGTDPDNNSTLYSAPINLPSGGTLKARAYKNSQPGSISEGQYTLIPAAAPNILIIVADDVGYGDLSCYGAPTVYTPHLDTLAREGTRFTQFTNTGPGDLPNQYSMLTGRVARRGNLPASLNTGQSGGIDSREWTLAESLRKTGYQTSFIGEWNLGDTAGSIATDQGFQLFYGLPYAQSSAPSPPLTENGSAVDAPHNALTLLSQLTTRAQTVINTSGSDPFFLVFSPPSIPATGTSLLGSHGDRVEALDSSIGQLLSTLESSGKTSNTLVIFYSDEGPDLTSNSAPLGSPGLFTDGKTTTWEGGVRVPAIAKWPGVIPSATDNYAVFWLPDLYASLAEITDSYTPSDRPFDGTSRADVLLAARTQPADGDPPLYLHRYDGSDYQLQAVREGSWKYHISYQNSDPQNTFSTAAPLLYDVQEDPTEHINRSSSHTSILVDLQQLVTDYEATFVAPTVQLPPANPAFLGAPALSFSTLSGNNSTFTSTLTRPLDSLNDHYVIQYSQDLSNWTSLAIDPFITSTTPQAGNAETLMLSLELDTPALSVTPLFIRLSATRP